MSDPDQMLREAVALHQTGALTDARALYEQVLAQRPDDPDALHLLGVLMGTEGAEDAGIALIERAIAHKPDFPTAFFNIGNLRASQGRHAEAVGSLEQCLALAPEHRGALSVAGRSLQSLGKMEKAAAYLQRAVRLDDTDALLWNDLGAALMGAGRLPEAADALRRSVRLRPDFAVAQRNLGLALMTCQHLGEAEQAFVEARRLDPANADLSLYLAAISESEGRPDEALAHLDRYLAAAPMHRPARMQRIRLFCVADRHADALPDLEVLLGANPDDAEVLAIRGGVHWRMLRLDAAEADLERSLALAPDQVPAWIDRGNVRQDRSDFAGALAAYDRALSIDPGNVTALTNRGGILQAMHHYPEALAAYDAALASAPDQADVRLSRGICLLRMGQWREAWQDWEARLRQPRWSVALDGFTAPRWDGRTDLTGKRVLVVGEQGLGDMIQFSRFVPRLTALGALVILGVEPPLRRLMESLAGIDAVATPGEAPDYDCYCLMMSLPALLGLDEAAFESRPYLRADDRDVAMWQARLSSWPGLKVGIAWAGDPRPEDHLANRIDLRRSVALRELSPLLETPGCTFISLQKGAAADQAKGQRVLDWTDELRDYADTAALMTALDLVVAVDTSVVHAAGALGRPIWVLNRYDRCWRWRWGRSDTPWYPTMRLYTQMEPGDWTPVVADIAADLRAYTAKGSVQAS
ncbi:MAG TPA: tetratricopeptide repeat protein [Rhodopila sp.]|nr:tetratricopeptide repeat protein [Rhodopila sp.]